MEWPSINVFVSYLARLQLFANEFMISPNCVSHNRYRIESENVKRPVGKLY